MPLVISIFVDELYFYSLIDILSFSLDDFCFTTTNYVYLFTISENNTYSGQTCWMLYLVLSEMNFRNIEFPFSFSKKKIRELESNEFF